MLTDLDYQTKQKGLQIVRTVPDGFANVFLNVLALEIFGENCFVKVEAW